MNVRRFDTILKILRENGDVKLQELTEKLNVSEATIRRDLTLLEKKGAILRVHGGAVLNTEKERDITTKKSIYSKEKEKIAKKAIEYVKDGDVVYLDAGSTTETLIKYLAKKENIVVVTNGITHFEELRRCGVEAFLLGGEIKFTTGATVGIGAVQALKTYNIDVAFMGSNAVDKNGFSTPDSKEAIIKSEVVKNTEKVYFLCDSSKFGKKTFINFASLEDGEIISEVEVPEEYLLDTRRKK